MTCQKVQNAGDISHSFGKTPDSPDTAPVTKFASAPAEAVEKIFGLAGALGGPAKMLTLVARRHKPISTHLPVPTW